MSVDRWNPVDPNQAAAHLRAKAKPKRRGWLADLSLAGVLLVAAVALAIGCNPRPRCVCPTCGQATLHECGEPTKVKSPDVATPEQAKPENPEKLIGETKP